MCGYPTFITCRLTRARRRVHLGARARRTHSFGQVAAFSHNDTPEIYPACVLIAARVVLWMGQALSSEAESEGAIIRDLAAAKLQAAQRGRAVRQQVKWHSNKTPGATLHNTKQPARLHWAKRLLRISARRDPSRLTRKKTKSLLPLAGDAHAVAHDGSGASQHRGMRAPPQPPRLVEELLADIAAASSAQDHWKACVALGEAVIEHAFYARVAECEAVLELAMQESLVPEASEDSDGVPFCDPRGLFATLHAVISFINALVNFTDGAIDDALPKVERANAVLAEQPDWLLGKCARLYCRALLGVLKIFRHEYANGAWQLIKAGWIMRGLDVDAMLVSDGVEKDELRQIALLVLGCLHIFGPMAKSFLPSWLTGRLDHTSAQMGVRRLQTCYHEGGIFAPVALILLHMQLFLVKRVLTFEPLSEEDVRRGKDMVDSFESRYPGSFIGHFLRHPILNHQQRASESTALVARYRATPEAQTIAPAIMMSLAVFNTRSQFIAMEWHDAGARMRECIELFTTNGRRAVIPTLAAFAALNFYASAAAAHPASYGGEASGHRGSALDAAEEMMRLLETHQKANPGKNWNPGDNAAFTRGEMLRASSHPDADALLELISANLGAVSGSQFRDNDADELQQILAWHLEANSPCAQDAEWRLFAMICAADLTMQRAITGSYSAQRRDTLLADALRQCEACQRLAPTAGGGGRGLPAQIEFISAKVLLMQGALPEALEATQRAMRLIKRQKPRLGAFVALRLQLPLLKAKIQKEQMRDKEETLLN